MILPILCQNFNVYFQGFSDLPLRCKISRVALPTIVGLAGLGLGIALAYYLFKPATASKPVDPQQKFQERETSPLMLSEEQLFAAAPQAVLDPQTEAHQLNLQHIFPEIVDHSYLIAQTPANFYQCDSFYKLAAEKAGLIITIGTSENYNFFKEGSIAAGPYLECIRGPLPEGPGCASYQFNFKALPPNLSESQRKNRTLWHLNVAPFSTKSWLIDIHHALDIVDQFIAKNSIDFDDRSLAVTSSGYRDQASIFILFHHLYHHFKKLAEKELKENPQKTDEAIADKLLLDVDITKVIEQRSYLIKKLSHGKFQVEEFSLDNIQYRDVVLLKLISKMRANLKIPLLENPIAPAKLEPAVTLEMLAGLNELIHVDPELNWEKWNKFILRMSQCESSLYKEHSINGTDAKLMIWEYIMVHAPSLANCQNFYTAMEKAAETSNLVPLYEQTTCRLFRDLTKQKLEQQGYTLCSIQTKPVEYKKQFLPLSLLDVLVQWYKRDNAHAEKADRLSTMLEELKIRQGIEHSNYAQLKELLQPLRDLEYGAQNYEQLQLLKMVVDAFEKEPKAAIKDYLKPVLIGTERTLVWGLLENITNLEGAVFLLLGECLTNEAYAYDWLKVLYKAAIEKFGRVPLESEQIILSPALYTKVKGFLIEILSNKACLENLYRGPEGRVALSCMWLQVEEAVLLKAVPLLFKEGHIIDQFILNSPLSDIWEKFASNPARIQDHPEACDLILECVFKSKCQVVRFFGFQDWLKTSPWTSLQTSDKLPRLRAAYQRRLNG